MKVKEYCQTLGIDANAFLEYARENEMILCGNYWEPESDKSILDEMIAKYVASNRKELPQEIIRKQEEKRKKFANMWITSGFNFDGYKIVKYSGYISGDAVTQVDRGKATSLQIFGIDFGTYGGTNTGTALENSLAEIRQKAIMELKMKAYDLDCNAVIGVDFDYITLEPETASVTGQTVYMPYVFCVTANGNAVVIEKI